MRHFVSDESRNQKKERVGKLLLQISVHELHRNLIDTVQNGSLECARNAERKFVISNMVLWYLLLPQFKPMTAFYKQTCGCKVCLSAASMQESLNAW